ncbi:hypothetical protein [Kitasatospora herbaricolor]|uniref:hypothetical protein n=1 Tax=Kitasatospora herbaricolor TaxID=68217 RepID=UPI0036DA3D70
MVLALGSLWRLIITGTMITNRRPVLVLDVAGRILLRRAVRAGRLKGRHSKTGHNPDL